MHTTRILFVDGEGKLTQRINDALMFVKGALEVYWGTYTLTEVASVEAALAVLARRDFDVLLVDLQLSGGNSENGNVNNGVNAVSRLANRHPQLPIVILTPEEGAAEILDALDRGAQDYLPYCEVGSRVLTRTLRSAIERKKAQLRVEQSRLDIIWRLAKAAEYRDEETGNHVVRVGCYCRAIALELGLPANFVQSLFLTAPLHDIGKIGIPDSILQKPGQLTEAERCIMQGHCRIGADILSANCKAMTIFNAIQQHVLVDHALDDPLRSMAASVALTHHERWSGGGYPRGLSREEIPLEGRIVALSDVYDALLSERPYKPAFSEEKALTILESGRGTHFDPDVYDAFLNCYEEIRGVREKFSDEQLPLAELLA